MRVVFADTGYWVALLNPRDDLHAKAIKLSKEVYPVHIFTSEMVLTEVLNDFSKRGDNLRLVAVSLIRQLQKHSHTTIIPQTSKQFEASLKLYESR
ncbi:MAG: nucleic acid-binding protein, partial [Cyanobacteria bacterium J06649_11]